MYQPGQFKRPKLDLHNGHQPYDALARSQQQPQVFQWVQQQPDPPQPLSYSTFTDVPVEQVKIQGSAANETSILEPIESMQEIVILDRKLWVKLLNSKEEYEKKKKELIKIMLDNFDELKAIDETTKLYLKAHVASFQEYLFERYFKFISINKVIGIALIFLIPLAYFALSFFFINRLWLNINHTVPPVFFNFVYLLLTFVLTNIFIYLYAIIYYTVIKWSEIKSKEASIKAITLLTGSLSISLVLLYFILINKWNHQFSYIVFIAATSLLSFIIRMIILYVKGMIEAIMVRYTQGMWMAHDPHLSVLNKLIFSLLLVESHPDNWINLKQKERLMLMLENASSYIERYWPQRIHAYDNTTNVWLKETMKEVATALRAKKRCILMPDNNGRDYFIKSIATTIRSIIDGNWDQLERMEPEKITSPQLINTIKLYLWKILKAILVAAIPIVGFIVFQQTSYALTGATLVSTISILFIYAVTVIMAAIDPNLNNKIDMGSKLGSILHR